MSNKSSGTAFECDFAARLSGYGFWVHRLQDNRNGQPFDVIAARNGKTYAIDCKECVDGIFRLSRMEENQLNAMRLWEETGNAEGLFAIRDARNGLVYMAGRNYLEKVREVKSYIRAEALPHFERWVSRA